MRIDYKLIRRYFFISHYPIVANLCPICDSKNTMEVLERGNVPIHQNVIYEDRRNSKKAPRGKCRYHQRKRPKN